MPAANSANAKTFPPTLSIPKNPGPAS